MTQTRRKFLQLAAATAAVATLTPSVASSNDLPASPAYQGQLCLIPLKGEAIESVMGKYLLDSYEPELLVCHPQDMAAIDEYFEGDGKYPVRTIYTIFGEYEIKFDESYAPGWVHLMSAQKFWLVNEERDEFRINCTFREPLVIYPDGKGLMRGCTFHEDVVIKPRAPHRSDKSRPHMDIIDCTFYKLLTIKNQERMSLNITGNLFMMEGPTT